MRRFIIPIVALALSAAPAVLEAQARGPGQRGPGALRRPGDVAAVGARILSHREALGLTAEQVAEIQAVRKSLREQTRPLVEELREQRAARRAQLTEEQRQRMHERRQQAHERVQARGAAVRARRLESMTADERAAIEQLRANSAAAAREIREALTAEQQARLRERRSNRR